MDNSATAAAAAAAVDGGSSQPKINNYFYSNNDKANFVYVLQHAAKYSPQGIKRAELVAMQLTEKMDDAVVKKDWVLAEEIKVNRDNWQKSADNERTLLQKCQFVLPRAKEKLTYHIKREEFKECAYYKGIVQVVDAYLAAVLEEDTIVEVEAEVYDNAFISGHTTTSTSVSAAALHTCLVVEGSNNKDDDIISIDDNNAEEDNVDDGDMEGGGRSCTWAISCKQVKKQS